MESRTSESAPALSGQMMQLIFGEFVSKALTVAAQLDIAELLSRGPLRVEQLASQAKVDSDALYRLLRALASVGVFQESEKRSFANSDLSNLLRNNSMKELALFLCGPAMWTAWNDLEYSVRTGRSAFEKVHGSHPFAHMKSEPEFAAVFNAAMTGLSAQELGAIHAKYDFSPFSTLVDVAGGCGALLTSCLERNPSQHGVLFDRSIVIEEARPSIDAAGVADRCKLVAGNFFESVPEGGDAYMMKYILHDWNDDEALTILRNIHKAARPGARLLIMDPVIRPENAPDLGKFMDLQMLVFYGTGRERTLQELKELLAAAKFKVARVVPTASAVSVIEAERY